MEKEVVVCGVRNGGGLGSSDVTLERIGRIGRACSWAVSFLDPFYAPPQLVASLHKLSHLPALHVHRDVYDEHVRHVKEAS